MSRYRELGFGGGSVRTEQWDVMKEYIEDHSVWLVLEIGTGFSTILMTEMGLYTVCYETNRSWIRIVSNKLKVKGYTNFEFKHYTYPVFPEERRRYDMAFVDGPGMNNFNGREGSMRFAAEQSNHIFVHDSARQEEREAANKVFSESMWEEEYFFSGLSLFVRRGESA